MALMLEVLDPRTGEVRQRRRLDAAGLTIGRGYDNDVILDDPYADVAHARVGVDETGATVLEDLGSLNALVAADGSRLRRLVVGGGTVVRIGKTRLRFLDADARLPAALPDAGTSAGRLTRWVGTAGGQASVVALATLAVGWMTWLGTYDQSGTSSAVSAALGALIGAALWAGIWAIAGRMVVHRFRYLAHLAVVSGAILVGLTVAVVADWGAFAFPASPVADVTAGVLVLGLATALVAGHLAIASSMSPGRRWTAGLVTSGILLALITLVTLSETESFSDVPSYAATLKPLPAALVPTGTVEGFASVAADLRREVDALSPPVTQPEESPR